MAVAGRRPAGDDALQDAGDVFLTGTELGGRFALRACILNFRTEEADLDTLLGAIRTAGERLGNNRGLSTV